MSGEQLAEFLPTAGLALAAGAAVYTAWHTTRGARRNQARQMAQHQFEQLVSNYSISATDAVELLGALQRYYYGWIRHTERSSSPDPELDSTIRRCLAGAGTSTVGKSGSSDS